MSTIYGLFMILVFFGMMACIGVFWVIFEEIIKIWKQIKGEDIG